MLLAGDIGGTKTVLALHSFESGPRNSVVQAEFHSADFPSLEVMVRQFLSEANLNVEAACFDVAGPVIEGHAKVTNLPWEIDAGVLRDALGLRSVHVLNDLVATARAVPELLKEDLYTLNEGGPVPGGAIAVVAPGTGLGEAFLTWDGRRYQAHPSEGGHADFAPTSPQEVGLLQYLQARYGHVSYERVCSGIGIPNIYDYLHQRGDIPERPEVEEELRAVEDRVPVIRKAATDPVNPSPLCRATLQMFVTVLAGEASNMALKVLATGGVYLGGGIPPRILPVLEAERDSFMHVFTRKGRFHDLLLKVPLMVITNRNAASIGAASCGLEIARQGGAALS